MSLKDDWKKVGKDWASLGKDLGKSIVKTVKVGVDKTNEWVEEDKKPSEEQKDKDNK